MFKPTHITQNLREAAPLLPALGCSSVVEPTPLTCLFLVERIVTFPSGTPQHACDVAQAVCFSCDQALCHSNTR